ncbi:thyroid peroxidase [Neosynchiropus ocellatus]
MAALLLFMLMLLCGTSSSESTEDASRLNATTLRQLIIASAEETLHMINDTSNRQRRSLSSSSQRVAFHRRTEPESLEIARAATAFHTTLRVLKSKVQQRYKRDIWAPDLLSWEEVELIAELSQCPLPTHAAICQNSHLSKYRTITGVCNNRQNPLWGSANIALVRWLPAEYEDGEREPKGWNGRRLHNGFQLPLSREVSQKVLETKTKRKDDYYSQLLVEWGQYIDHDFTFTPQSSGAGARWIGAECLNVCDNMDPCYPIEAKDLGQRRCLPFSRSLPACYTDFGSDIRQAVQQQQLNTITSFIDASMVYGNNKRVADFLRDHSGRSGKLRVNSQFKDPTGRSYLPFEAKVPSDCKQGPHDDRVECVATGDNRVSESLSLISLHTLWLREHNRIAETLKTLNPHYSPETIYQEARKIVGALHQIITMRDYFPKIIGPEAFEYYIGPYRGYNPAVNPSAANVFATAAFRFGHATVSPIVWRLNETFQPHERFRPLRLHESFFSPWRIVKEGGIEPVLRGFIGTPASHGVAEELLTDELTDKLVVLRVPQDMDLGSLNMQRGRDHAIPGKSSYNAWREFCGLERIRTVEELADALGSRSVAEKIFQLYNHPDNIDLYLGGIAERFLRGARTGPVFACLIAKQLKAMRDGDRFWWEHDTQFTPWQKEELFKHSLSRIICDNTAIQEVPYDAFTFMKHPAGYFPCSHIPALNLEAWREITNPELERCGSPRLIANGDYILSTETGNLVALYSCYHGYKLKGAAALVCEGGRWKGQPPQCTAEYRGHA